MNSVKRIIEVMRKDMDGLAAEYIKLQSPGFMDLVIEAIGRGPRGLPAVSVAHYYRQNGDAMRDPEVTFEIEKDGTWVVTSYLQDSLGIFQEVFEGDRATPKLARDLAEFVAMWSDNIEAQGFVEAAERAVQA